MGDARPEPKVIMLLRYDALVDFDLRKVQKIRTQVAQAHVAAVHIKSLGGPNLEFLGAVNHLLEVRYHRR